MKKISRTSLFVVLLSFIFTTVPAQEYPKATGYVNDFARLLTREQDSSLNQELIAFEKKTTIEIVVVTVTSLNGKNIETFTQELATEWGVGKRNKNNGIAFLVAPNDHKMRIQPASGIISVFTNEKATAIMNEVILPLLKAHNMSKGIIDGTHAIINALSETPSSVVSTPITQETTPTEQPKTEWTSYNTKVLIFCIVGLIALFIAIMLLMPIVNRKAARSYVLENKDIIGGRLVEAERLAKKSDINDALRTKVAALKSTFSPISRITVDDKHEDWIKIQEELDSLDYRINSVISTMEDTIAKAEEARKEGPKLLEQIPNMLQSAKEKLASGKHSPKAQNYLKKAEAQYEKVKNEHSGMSTIDWVVIYLLLQNIQSTTANAEAAHDYANTDHSSSGTSGSWDNKKDDDYTPSNNDNGFGFGSNDGLGGGGGFNVSDGVTGNF